jgi:histidinol-phosphatase (PHP family)
MKFNYHTHSEFCDGSSTAAEFAQTAKELDYSILGFSSHAPLPFATEWNMEKDKVAAYITTIRQLAAHYQQKPVILCGMEIDYIEKLWGPRHDFFAGLELDYCLGAVHYMYHPDLEPERYVAVDMKRKELDSYIKLWYGGDSKILVQSYYNALAQCIQSGGFEILAHLDLIKKNNGDKHLFDPEAAWYRKTVLESLDALDGTDIIVEINTGGLARKKTTEVYPAVWILKELKQRGVQICINADAHRTSHLDCCREAGLEAARLAGYNEMCILDQNGRRTIGLQAE